MYLERQEIMDYCLSYSEVYEDYPFRDSDWCVMRHKENDKIFAWIFTKDGHVRVNVKCALEWVQFWRNAFGSVIRNLGKKSAEEAVTKMLDFSLRIEEEGEDEWLESVKNAAITDGIRL